MTEPLGKRRGGRGGCGVGVVELTGFGYTAHWGHQEGDLASDGGDENHIAWFLVLQEVGNG